MAEMRELKKERDCLPKEPKRVTTKGTKWYEAEAAACFAAFAFSAYSTTEEMFWPR